MSLFSKLGSFVKRAVSNPIVQAGLMAVPGAGPAVTALRAATTVASAAGTVGSLPAKISTVVGAVSPPGGGLPTLPLLPGAATSIGAKAGIAAGRALVPSEFSTGGTLRGYHAAKDGSGRMVRNRRMNATNPRALNRAVRRIKAFRRMAAKVERSLPKQRTTRRVPPRYSRRGSGTSIVNVD